MNIESVNLPACVSSPKALAGAGRFVIRYSLHEYELVEIQKPYLKPTIRNSTFVIRYSLLLTIAVQGRLFAIVPR